MAEPLIQTRSVLWTPVSAGVTEAVNIRQVKKGSRILWMSCRAEVPGDKSATQALQIRATYGTYGATTILMTDRTIGVGVTVSEFFDGGTGPGMNQAGGWLSATDGFLQAVYNSGGQNGTGGTAPVVRITYAEHRPFPQ